MTSIRMALSLLSLMSCSLFISESSGGKGDFVVSPPQTITQNLPEIRPLTELQELAQLAEQRPLIERTPASRKAAVAQKGG